MLHTCHTVYISCISQVIHVSCKRRLLSSCISSCVWVHVMSMSTCHVNEYMSSLIHSISCISHVIHVIFKRRLLPLCISSCMGTCHVNEYMSCLRVNVLSHTSPSPASCMSHSCVMQEETPLIVYLLMYEYMSCL